MKLRLICISLFKCLVSVFRNMYLFRCLMLYFIQTTYTSLYMQIFRTALVFNFIRQFKDRVYYRLLQTPQYWRIKMSQQIKAPSRQYIRVLTWINGLSLRLCTRSQVCFENVCLELQNLPLLFSQASIFIIISVLVGH